MRPHRLAASVLVLALTAPFVPSSAATEPAPRAAGPKCLDSAKVVAVEKLKARGKTYGKAVITVSTEPQGTYNHVVCGYTVPTKRFARRQHVVRQTFLHFASDGDRLGMARRDTYANRRAPVIFASSWMPDGQRYVLKVRLEAGHTAKASVSYRAPSSS